MPLEVFDTTDTLKDLIHLRTSAIYETIISLHTLLFSDRHEDWASQARASLPPDLLEEARAIYEPYKQGQNFYELALDYPDHDDVPGFAAHVRHMDPTVFLFYVVGRVFPLEQLAAVRDNPTALDQLLRTEASEWFYDGWLSSLPLDELLADIPAVQNRLADVWERYWNEFFSTQVASLRPHWESALAEKERILARDGGEALFDHISEGKSLPPPLPPDQPYTEITCIPIYLLHRSIYLFFGYGNVTLLFNSQRTEARVAELERARDDVLEAAKALGDSTRLKILRAIAMHEGVLHGKGIAEKIGLSPSAVSRHLTQLREAGLIVEVPLDRVIAYRIQKDVIEALPQKLLDYLYT